MDKREQIARMAQTKEDEILLARVYERITSAAARNIPAATAFLSKREQMLAAELLRGQDFVFFGGPAMAEREVCCYVPEYLDESWLTGDEGPIAAVRAVYFAGDTLTHRDFLGALMGCGIKRDTVEKLPEDAAEKEGTGTKAQETDAPAISTAMQPTLSFGDTDTLVWPVVGNVLINYSMDKTVYFPTLDQYKYNPAIVIAANEGDMITAAAAGKVTSVFEYPQIGQAVTMDLGNGYEITYGQLKEILVSEGSYVSMGDMIASVAAPTKYYSIEGTNVYFKLTKDGNPVNPMTRLS